MVNIVAIETATAAVSVAARHDGAIVMRGVRDATARAETVLELLRALCTETGMPWPAVDAIAFGRGPGSFTGLRVAAAVAQGLAYAHRRPVVPVSSLAALAQEAPGQRILAAIDARRDEVYYGLFRRLPTGLVVADGPEHLAAPDAIGVPADTDTGVGSGFDHYRERWQFHGGLRHVPDLLPSAAGVLRLAEAAYGRGDIVDARLAAPVYLRDEVAIVCS